MKIKTVVHCLLGAALLLAGPVSHAKEAKEKPVLERGWMGGTYDCARYGWTWSEWLFGADHTMYTFPPALAKSQTAAIFTASLGTNTPAYLAGLRPGDLILQLDNQPVTNLPAFWQAVTGRRPGASLLVKVWRAGQTNTCRVTVGREKYQPLGYLTVGLPGYLRPLHPIPTWEAPRFSLMALGYEHPDDRPVEFASVKDQYEHNCHPREKPTGYDPDWRFWLAIVEVKYGKKILSQEIVPAGK